MEPRRPAGGRDTTLDLSASVVGSSPLVHAPAPAPAPAVGTEADAEPLEGSRQLGRGRNGVLDALKGLAIVLVAIGHALQTAYADFDANPLFRVIYSFHMPFFMFLSGIAACYSRDLVSVGSIGRRARVLVLPFAAWYVASYVILHRWDDIGLRSYVTQVIRSPDYGLWFLWILFLCYCTLAVTLRLERRIGPFAFLLVFGLVYKAPVVAYGMVLLRWHLFFFFGGYLLMRAGLKWRLWWGIAPSLAFLPLALEWRRNSDPGFAPRLAAQLASAQLSSLDHLALKTYQYLVPCLGIVACMTLVTAAYRWRALLLAPFLWLAPYTLDIYAIHVYFLRWHLTGVTVVPAAALAIAGALAVSILLLRRLPLLRTLFLGGRSA